MSNRANSRFLVLALALGFLATGTAGASAQDFVLARLFAATDDGVFVSYSWGEHWSRIRGDMRGFTGQMRAFLCLGPTVYVGGTDGLFVSDDFGESYRRERFPGTEVRGFLSSRLFALDPTLFVWTETALYRSTDAGLKWEAIGDGVLSGKVSQMDWPGPELLALTERGLYVSRDAGRRWERLGEGLPDARLQSLEVARYFALEPTVFVGTEGSGLYKSVDGGKTFEPLPDRLLAQATVRVVFWWGSLLLVGTDDGLLLSKDGGESFEASRALQGRRVQSMSVPGADADVPSDVIVGTDRGVYKSSDGALSFRLVDEGLGEPSVLDLATFPITPQDRERKRR